MINRQKSIWKQVLFIISKMEVPLYERILERYSAYNQRYRRVGLGGFWEDVMVCFTHL